MSKFGTKNEESGSELACFNKNMERYEVYIVGNERRKSRHLRKRKSNKKKSSHRNKSESINKINVYNELCCNPNELKSAVLGGDDDIEAERLWCRQHELNVLSNEINRSDVITMSCDITSNSKVDVERGNENEQKKRGKKNCPSNRLNSKVAFQSICSEGSYSRRKHHQKHHKQKERSKALEVEDVTVNPKVNPVFLWVRQEDTRIVEVLCEDYDRRNRLKLTRTHLGWRAIPKTKCFAEAIIPKASQNDLTKTIEKPKNIRRAKKWKRLKKEKNENIQKIESEHNISAPSQQLGSNQHSHSFSCGSPISKSMESLIDSSFFTSTKTLTKSKSCDFLSIKKPLYSLTRSVSMDCNDKPGFYDWKKFAQHMLEATDLLDKSETKKKEVLFDLKEGNERVATQSGSFDDHPIFIDDKMQNVQNDQSHSALIIMDMTKHDSDFNDADCDELGELLNDIPDLEFVDENDLEEVNEDEWSVPTDLTLPKPSVQIKPSPTKCTIHPSNISPLTTMTSTTKPLTQLAAPLPDVTITPIPKPAHQQKPQNNFLECLLTVSKAAKPKNIESKVDKKSPNFFERKTSKHFCDTEFCFELKNKKPKLEEITLRNLLSNHCGSGAETPIELETCFQKAVNTDEFSKSRLFQELLTDKIPSDPIAQLKELLSNPLFAVPDPLLVPRARLPALVASPAIEIPRLLTLHSERATEEKPRFTRDSDVLEISISNLQTLLSTCTDILNLTNPKDMAKYQKSLETFLAWQRYQTELIEAQISSNNCTAESPNKGPSTAFGQMLWLPYLNQFEFNTNRDVASLMYSILNNNCQGSAANLLTPPEVNVNQFAQSSPFLTPTSPMDIESHLKTLAMWQEAVAMQQSFHTPRPCPISSLMPAQDQLKSSKPMLLPVRRQNKPSAVTPISFGGETPQFAPAKCQDDVYKRQRQGHRPNQIELSQKLMQEQCIQHGKLHRSHNYQNEILHQWKASGEKKRPIVTDISNKSKNALEKNNTFRREFENAWESHQNNIKNSEISDTVEVRRQQFGTQIRRTTFIEDELVAFHQQDPKITSNKQNLGGSPKLKVKNLVDPNRAPPVLLNQIAPEHQPTAMRERSMVPEDANFNLWHPLFGSNQIRAQPYNSPWRWTTVTVNGE